MASKDTDEVSLRSNYRFSDLDGERHQMLLPIEGYEKMPIVCLEDAVNPLVDLLPDIHRKAWIAKCNCQNPADHLSTDESAAIYLYSMEWEPHNECLYFLLNATLRNKSRDKLKPWFSYLKLLLTALARLPSIHTTVYRGIKRNLIEDYPRGKQFVWWGFSSCTSSIDVLQSELFLGNTHNRTMFTIECFNGKDIQRHSYYETEHEILILAATQFQVVASLNQGKDLNIVQLKEIQPPYPLIQPVIVSRPYLIKPASIKNSALEPMTIPPKKKSTSTTQYQNLKLRSIIERHASCGPIDLKNQQLVDLDVPIIIKYAIINKTCTSLWLTGNKLTSESMQDVALALDNNEHLKILWLNNNRICDAGIQLLARILAKNNSSLTKLDLGKTNMKNNGARNLADMLKSNTILTHL